MLLAAGALESLFTIDVREAIVVYIKVVDICLSGMTASVVAVGVPTLRSRLEPMSLLKQERLMANSVDETHAGRF